MPGRGMVRRGFLTGGTPETDGHGEILMASFGADTTLRMTADTAVASQCGRLDHDRERRGSRRGPVCPPQAG